MLTYCEPCPGNRNAILPESPWLRKIPCAVSAFQSPASSRSNAFNARSILLLSSGGLLKSSAIRSGDRKSLSSGASPVTTRLASASALSARRRLASSDGFSAPIIAIPPRGARTGSLEAAIGGAPMSSTAAGTAWYLRPPPVRRPGTYSSKTAWKLVPPKPKALTPARRTPLSGFCHSRRSPLT